MLLTTLHLIYPFITPIQPLPLHYFSYPLLSHLHQQPPSPSTSELLLTTLTQAVSFITVMDKHPIHST
ncbi:hypothetical protein, partial [Providencia sp. 1709051003]